MIPDMFGGIEYHHSTKDEKLTGWACNDYYNFIHRIFDPFYQNREKGI